MVVRSWREIINNRTLLRAQIIIDSRTLMELLCKTKKLFQTAGNSVLNLICYDACNFSSLFSTIIAYKIIIQEDDLHVLPMDRNSLSGYWKKQTKTIEKLTVMSTNAKFLLTS